LRQIDGALRAMSQLMRAGIILRAREATWC